MNKKIYKSKKIIAYFILITLMFTYLNIDGFTVNAEDSEDMITLFFVDNSDEKWIKNDNAVIELVDNSNGHIHYDMTKSDDCTWKADIPKNAYNITFNRYNPEKTTQWNSWSAGGRENNNTYYADGHEYGHWAAIEHETEEKYFHAGDVIYIDVSEFEEWKNDEALMYVNFTNASKEENAGYDIDISNSDILLYNPQNVEDIISDNIYKYVVSEDDEGATELRFWRGNSEFLWNCSILFTYDDFEQTGNCIKITNWNNQGYICNYYQNKYLYSDKNEVFIDSDSETLYFYINVMEDIENEIKLYENDTQIGTFYDDGNFANHGDDIKGDGIYSSKYILNKDTYTNEECSYYAEFSDGIKTNTIKINIIVPFTEKELSDMDYVNNKVSEVLVENKTPESLLNIPSEFLQNGTYSDDYKILHEKRCNELEIVLESLLNDGYIQEFTFDTKNRVYNCKYSNGVIFAIITDDFCENNNYDNEDMKLLSGTNIFKDYSGYSAVILNTFEDTSYRTKFYEKFVAEWEANGMDVDYDDYVTVDDLKTKLFDKDLIALSGHGTILDSHSTFCLEDENLTKDNLQKYANDILTERVINTLYADGRNSLGVTGYFFSNYYGNNGLSESFVFSESCMFMGDNETGINTEFADALLDCSAAAVIGFHNSVMADYSRKLMLSYFENLLSGNTVGNSFQSAKEKHGYDDYKYREPSFLEYLLDKDTFEKMGATAYPVLRGNREATINKEFRNGDFEIPLQQFFSIPFYWKYEGDVRVLNKLGNIKAYGKHMAFLSTGIGCKSGVSLSGTQGSTMSQIIRNIDKTTLEFTYDIISEEPMEYVGSKYDDKFEIQILDSKDNILYSEIIESVNSTNWYLISGINFDGGDNTVYHTHWKTKSIDISDYQNQIIKIKFLVYDVGDSAYDTAALIDNVKLS